MDLKELITLVLNHIYGMWRFRWVALATAWVVALAGWAFVYLMPDKYEASAQVYVDTDSVLRPLLKGLSVQTDVLNDVTIMTRTMLSRPSLEKVARETDLDLRAKTPVEYEGLLNSLADRIKVARAKNNIFAISFEDADRTVALRVVEELLNSFVEDTLGSGQEDSVQAERTLKEQITSYEKRLTEAEDRLKEFKRKNVGLMPGEYGDYYAQLQTANANLEATKQSIRVARQRRATLQRQLEGEEPVFGIMTSNGTSRFSSVDGQIQQLQQRLADLQIDYTDKHPEVLRVTSLLEDLKKKRAEELATTSNSSSVIASSNPLDMNPVYQNIKIQLSNAEVDLASLQAQLADRKSKVDNLKQQVNVIPQVEAELNRLNRDYGVVKSRYDTMLARWEDLQTAKKVRSGTDEVQFRIIEPPFAASQPVGPPRALFVMAIFILATGTGIGVAFILNLIWPVFAHIRQMETLGFPVIGSVNMVYSDEAVLHRRRLNIALIFMAIALSISAAVVMMFAQNGAHLLQRVF